MLGLLSVKGFKKSSKGSKKVQKVQKKFKGFKKFLSRLCLERLFAKQMFKGAKRVQKRSKSSKAQSAFKRGQKGQKVQNYFVNFDTFSTKKSTFFKSVFLTKMRKKGKILLFSISFLSIGHKNMLQNTNFTIVGLKKRQYLCTVKRKEYNTIFFVP